MRNNVSSQEPTPVLKSSTTYRTGVMYRDAQPVARISDVTFLLPKALQNAAEAGKVDPRASPA